MNIYKSLNDVINYLEDNLTEKIDYNKISKILGVNVYTSKRIFNLIANISISEYVRKRRLSNAGYDLYKSNLKILDVAIKYQYDNATSFSRAFSAFHGIKPSEIKKGKFKLKNFPKLHFKESVLDVEDINYEIKTLPAFILYGKGIKTNEKNINKDAPLFWRKMNNEFFKEYGSINYGMVLYENRFISENLEYWILWNKEINKFKKIEIPKSKWLIFHIPNTKAKEIQNMSKKFYCKFLPSSKYNLRDLPELEYYHDNTTDFLVAIE